MRMTRSTGPRNSSPHGITWKHSTAALLRACFSSNTRKRQSKEARFPPAASTGKKNGGFLFLRSALLVPAGDFAPGVPLQPLHQRVAINHDAVPRVV